MDVNMHGNNMQMTLCIVKLHNGYFGEKTGHAQSSADRVL